MRATPWARRGGKTTGLIVFAMLVAWMLPGCWPLWRDATPDVPADLEASEGAYADHVRLEWSEVQGATRYDLARAALEDGPYDALAELVETRYDDADVTPGVVYWYRVRACADGRCSPWSAPVSGYAEAPPEDAPPPPTGITASRGTHTDRVRVRWDEAPAATQYAVYRAGDQFGHYTRVGETPDTEFEDTTVTPGMSYWFRVRACNVAGCSPLSAQAAWGFAELPPDGVPNPPRDVVGSEGDHGDKIRVTWHPAPGAERYDVYRSTAQDGTYTQVGAATDTTFDDVHHATANPLTPCAVYWYRVRACNDEGCSEHSRAGAGHRGTPMTVAPGGVTVTDGAFVDRIEIAWEPVEGAAHYRLYRHDLGYEPGQHIAELEETNYEDEVPQAFPTTYSYRVQACGEGDCGCSPLSLPVEGSASNLPAVPENVAASQVTGGIRISWEPGTAIEDATHYNVFRAVGGQYARVNPAPITATQYTDTTGVSGTSYTYYVVAVNANGSSVPSQEVSAQMP